MNMNISSLVTGVVVLLGLACSPAVSLGEEGYPVPDVSKAALTLEEKQYIADKVPPTEIEIKTYKDPGGTLVRVYSAAGAVFRYDISSKGEPPYEYRLLDMDGDGVFETKEDMVGEMTVQEKGQKFYIDLGPEPGKEYKYRFPAAPKLGIQEVRQVLMGYPIYIPQWVLVRFR